MTQKQTDIFFTANKVKPICMLKLINQVLRFFTINYKYILAKNTKLLMSLLLCFLVGCCCCYKKRQSILQNKNIKQQKLLKLNLGWILLPTHHHPLALEVQKKPRSFIISLKVFYDFFLT